MAIKTDIYIMPAEWEKHSATILAWPHNKADWPDKFSPIPWVYAEIIKNLTQNERVVLLVRSEEEKLSANDICERSGADIDKIDFHTIPTNRVWMRDSGPIFVRSSEKKDSGLTMLDFRFNAWAKYSNHKFDNKVPSALNHKWNLPIVQPTHKGRHIVLEGGAIDVNGCGMLLTTEECLLSDVQVRNRGFTREDYEEIFEKYLGISKVIWLGHGIVGDDTHGHVDDITRFVAKDSVVTVVEKNKSDGNYALLKENVKRLKSANLNVIELPMPKPVIFEGQRLPASYANFLIANDIVLVPTFNDANDRIALNILSEIFPKRQIIGIHALDLVWGLGTIHCMSQQIPLRCVD